MICGKVARSIGSGSPLLPLLSEGLHSTPQSTLLFLQEISVIDCVPCRVALLGSLADRLPTHLVSESNRSGGSIHTRTGHREVVVIISSCGQTTNSPWRLPSTQEQQQQQPRQQSSGHGCAAPSVRIDQSAAGIMWYTGSTGGAAQPTPPPPSFRATAHGGGSSAASDWN